MSVLPMVTTMPAVVELRSVTKSFGSIVALHDITIDIVAQSISVLLGPNGAGKTTAIRLITGALDPDHGSVAVLGLDPAHESQGEEVRRRCGVVSAKPSLYDRLDGWDNLRYAAELFGLGRGLPAERRIAEAADQFGILGALDQRVGGYSTGMKTRLALARSILHRPELLLLDEPTSGLDPESAAAVLDLIRTMTTDGQTVIMCTHLLLEAEGLADQVVVMEDGAAMISGRPPDLARRYWPEPVVRLVAESGPELDPLAHAVGVAAYERTDDTATLTLDTDDRVADLIMALSQRGVRLRAVEPYHPTLEDLYFAVRGSSRAKASLNPVGVGAR
jgi:ABC-2 type transport system ATP-binding protein